MRKINPYDMRKYLLSFSICLSYVVFIVFGIFLVKYQPSIVNYLDWSIIPIGLSCIVFIYLFALTYERKISPKISQKVLDIVKLYGQGKSFKDIAIELNLSSQADVKYALEEFCRLKGE